MRAVALLVPLAAALGCREPRVNSDIAADPLATVPAAALERLATRRIYFGHQSVGHNLVDGLKAVLAERPGVALRVVETRAPAALVPGTFGHSENGRNQEPETKIRDFTETILKGGVGDAVDVAFFKFCYVDVTARTDVTRLFQEYRRALMELKVARPNVRFVHVTVPLSVVATGPKEWLRGLLGKRTWGADANVARERFNALLRREYGGKEPLFDLAAVESTRPDGTVQAFKLDGRMNPSLYAGYSSDGSHLNDVGARWAAAHLLAFLASGTGGGAGSSP